MPLQEMIASAICVVGLRPGAPNRSSHVSRRRSEDLARLERDVSLERLVQARGVELVAQEDGQLVGLCPLHEGEGQLVVDPKANTWTCSTCSAEEGTVVTWVMRTEGISQSHAIELLKSDFAGSAPATPKKRGGRQKGVVPQHSTTRRLDAPFGRDEPDEVLLARVVDFYHDSLKQSPEALAYLEGRGITSSEVVEHFKLGFANRALAYRLPSKNRRVGSDLRGRLQNLGVLRKSGHEHLNGCVVAPLFDAQHRVINIYGRKITSNLRPGTELHCWLDDIKKGVFNLGAFESSKTIIVTGSILDALAVWSHGQRHVTAVHGLDGPTEDLVAAVKEHDTQRLVLAFRRSSEGDAAAERIGGDLSEAGVEVLRVLLPAGMDVTDVIRSGPNPPEAVAHLIRSAEWMSGKSSSAATTAGPMTAIVASAPAAADTTKSTGAARDEVVLAFDDRRWRVRGLGKTRPETMKVNLMVSRDGAAFHVDVVELYSARQRTSFTKMASDELGLDEVIIKRDMGHVLLKLEEAQDELLRQAHEPETKPVEMTDEDREAALALLRDPQPLDRILNDFETIGVAGERTNLLVGYLAAVSRKLDQPLAVVIQSSSAAGKSSLMEAILSFVPEEDRMSFSAMTGQALYYMHPTALKHRVLSVAEEAGAERAAYAMKLLQSEGQLVIASTGKDPGTGRLISQEYRVEGPVALMMTTTAIDIDEELLSRCLVLSVDESPEQTRAIQERQRAEMTLEGRLGNRDRLRIIKVHQNAQRLLKPMVVVNPFAGEMAFGDHRVKARRDHRKLLGLIESLALLHQHQRQVKTIEHGGHVVEYIEVTKADIDIATKLMAEIGGPGIDDLPPQCYDARTMT